MAGLLRSVVRCAGDSFRSNVACTLRANRYRISQNAQFTSVTQPKLYDDDDDDKINWETREEADIYEDMKSEGYFLDLTGQKQGRNMWPYCSHLTDATKDHMYKLHMEDPQRWTTAALAQEYRIREQRAMAIIALKTIENEMRAAGEYVDDEVEQMIEEVVHFPMPDDYSEDHADLDKLLAEKEAELAKLQEQLDEADEDDEPASDEEDLDEDDELASDEEEFDDSDESYMLGPLPDDAPEAAKYYAKYIEPYDIDLFADPEETISATRIMKGNGERYLMPIHTYPKFQFLKEGKYVNPFSEDKLLKLQEQKEKQLVEEFRKNLAYNMSKRHSMKNESRMGDGLTAGRTLKARSGEARRRPKGGFNLLVRPFKPNVKNDAYAEVAMYKPDGTKVELSRAEQAGVQRMSQPPKRSRRDR